MKVSVRFYVIVSVLLCCIFACGKNIGKAFDTDEEYTITVVGGHAVNGYNGDGETIVSAKFGEHLSLVADIKEGEFVKGWKSDSVELSIVYYEYDGLLHAEFDMPAKNVTIYAVTAKQTPLTIDLKNGYQKLPGYQSWYNNYNNYNPIDAWICQSAGCKGGYYTYNADIDGDGTEDLCFSGSEGWHYPSVYTLIPLYGGSLSGSIVLNKPNAGPYWPITIKMPAEPVHSEYTITVNGGTAKKSVDEGDGKTTLTVKPGEGISLSADKVQGSYVSAWLIDGVREADGYFVMPAKDVSAAPVLEKQKSYTVDFSKGFSADISDDVYWFSGIKHLEDGCDINGDEKADFVQADPDYNRMVPLYDENRKGEYTLSGGTGSIGQVIFKFPEVKPEYEIKVTGGHAEDEKGNIITKAASGTKIIIRRDPEAGKYWKAWKSDYQTDLQKNITFYFTMPARDVSFTAETTSKQSTYTLDFTDDFVDLSDKDRVLLFNALCAYNGYTYYYGALFFDYIDADQDGTKDFTLGPRDEMGDVPGYGMDRRYTEYSLGTDYTITINDGPIGKLRLVINNKKADAQVKDSTKGPFTVTLSGEVEFNESSQGKKISDTVYEVYPGEKVYVVGNSGDDGSYCSKLVCDGLDTSAIIRIDRKPLYMDFYMPYNNVTITGDHVEPIPLVLDLTSGSCQIDADLYFPEFFSSIARKEVTTSDYKIYHYDLDFDGKADLTYDCDTNTLTAEKTPYTLKRESETFDGPANGSGYWPLTIKFSDEPFYPIENKAVFTDKESEGKAYVTVYMKADTEWYETKTAKAGSELKLEFDKVSYGNELTDYYYMNEAGERFEFDDKNYTETEDTITVTGFKMPAEKIIIVCHYRKYQVPTPTPNPTDSVEPTAAPTPDEGGDTDVTPVPGEKKDDAEKDDADNSDVLYIILASAGAFIITCAVVFAVYRKRRKAAAKTENATEQPEETLNQMEESLTSEIPSEETAETPENAESEISDQTGEIPDTDSNRNE